MTTLERAFTRMGARVKFSDRLPRPWWAQEREADDFSLDVRRDARGEYYLFTRNPKTATEFLVLDVQPVEGHLLLLSRTGEEKHRFLLGHDERHWFVAGIPETAAVSQVKQAKQALKPEAVQMSESVLRAKHLHRRINRARVRQGEWFFVPAPGVNVPELLMLRYEPLLRSRGGKAHVCEQAFRVGGETVYVGPGAPNGLTEDEYRNLSEPDRKNRTWQVMKRNPTLYVRGRVRHPDHKTVVLNSWHQVFSNTEHQSYAMRNVVFLD
jgi:hypothetical protein